MSFTLFESTLVHENNSIKHLENDHSQLLRSENELFDTLFFLKVNNSSKTLSKV